jgi:hypothetical protein
VSPVKARPVETPVKDWVAEVSVTSALNMRERIVFFLLRAYGLLLAGTMLIYFLQGFNVAGFHLDAELLRWLGAATVGEIGGLLSLTVGHSFTRKGGSSPMHLHHW